MPEPVSPLVFAKELFPSVGVQFTSPTYRQATYNSWLVFTSCLQRASRSVRDGCLGACSCLSCYAHSLTYMCVVFFWHPHPAMEFHPPVFKNFVVILLFVQIIFSSSTCDAKKKNLLIAFDQNPKREKRLFTWWHWVGPDKDKPCEWGLPGAARQVRE